MAGILSVQIKSVLSDKCVNFRKVEHFIKRNADKGLDLVVLPEFFATNNEYLNLVEPIDGGEAIEFVKGLAKKFNTNIIAGSVVREEENKLYNTSFAINRSGEIIQKYNKIHLYNFFGGTEGERITAGNEIVVAEFDFARVGMAICFDIRFPLHFLKLVKENVDIIAVPCAWLIPDDVYNNQECLEVAVDMWKSICKTRAYDNGVYLVISNQTKEAAQDMYGLGASMIIAPNAQILADAKDKECGIYADIDINVVKYMRQLFPLASLN